jgi:hypothetical protein
MSIQILIWSKFWVGKGQRYYINPWEKKKQKNADDDGGDDDNEEEKKKQKNRKMRQHENGKNKSQSKDLDSILHSVNRPHSKQY